jgi:hypothetical protein
MTVQKACIIFNRLLVNTIENTSGIFVGNNQAIAWRHFGKTNQGFGSLQEAAVSCVVNVVQDSDGADATYRDFNQIALTESPNRTQQCAVEFRAIQANALNNGSAIDIGDNKQTGWRNAHKANYGNSKNMGYNKQSNIAAFMTDNDAMDATFRAGEQITDTQQTVKNIRIIQRPDSSHAENDLQG